MTRAERMPADALGFLTVLHHEQLGLVGGYLLLNTAGRPLEFHCTAPVKPNRAQEILFGPTLDAYLYGEQIGQTLIAKGSVEPLAVCTDVERVLSVRDYVKPPVALVLPVEGAGTDGAALVQPTKTAGEWRVDIAHAATSRVSAFSLGSNRLAVPSARSADREAIESRLAAIASFDLAEPFERIREAVEEAHKANRP